MCWAIFYKIINEIKKYSNAEPKSPREEPMYLWIADNDYDWESALREACREECNKANKRSS